MFRSSLLALALLSSCADARQLEDLGQLEDAGRPCSGLNPCPWPLVCHLVVTDAGDVLPGTCGP